MFGVVWGGVGFPGHSQKADKPDTGATEEADVKGWYLERNSNGV